MARTIQTQRRHAAPVDADAEEHDATSAHPRPNPTPFAADVSHAGPNISTASGTSTDAVGSTSSRPAGLRDALADALTAVDRLTALNADLALAILDADTAFWQLPSSSATMAVPDDRRFELLSASTKGTAWAVLHHGVRAPSDQMRRATRDPVEALKAAKGTVELVRRPRSARSRPWEHLLTVARPPSQAEAPVAVVPAAVPAPVLPPHAPPPPAVAAVVPAAPSPPATTPPYIPPPPPVPPAPPAQSPPPIEAPATPPPQAPLASEFDRLPEQGIARWSGDEIPAACSPKHNPEGYVAARAQFAAFAR